jgi:hypothetical protein
VPQKDHHAHRATYPAHQYATKSGELFRLSQNNSPAEGSASGRHWAYCEFMIPSAWREHRRQDDDELLGYILPTDEAFQARTVFGYPVGAVCDQQHAEQTLESIGLSYLAERWLLSIDGRDEPITVQIVEATLDVPIEPDRLRPERSLA